MTQRIFFATLTVAFCLVVASAQAQRGREAGGREGEKPAGNRESEKPTTNKAPGGDWGERTHSGKQSTTQPGREPMNTEGATAGNPGDKNKSSQASGAQAPPRVQPPRIATSQRQPAQGAAAGAAAANNKNPQATGAGAAAGAAAVNRNQPQYSGAQGAAAGAAAANRNQPQYSGAEGAAVGAAAANRNSPQMTGARRGTRRGRCKSKLFTAFRCTRRVRWGPRQPIRITLKPLARKVPRLAPQRRIRPRLRCLAARPQHMPPCEIHLAIRISTHSNGMEIMPPRGRQQVGPPKPRGGSRLGPMSPTFADTGLPNRFRTTTV